MIRRSRRLLPVVTCLLLALTAVGCGDRGTAETTKSNALAEDEQAFLLKSKKVKNQILGRWNDIVRIVENNDWNVVNISDGEHDVIQRKLNAVADVANKGMMDSPSPRFNKLMHLWDSYLAEVIDLDNAMGDLLGDPTDTTRRAYERAFAAEEKARKAFDREARRLIAASLKPAQ